MPVIAVFIINLLAFIGWLAHAVKMRSRYLTLAGCLGVLSLWTWFFLAINADWEEDSHEIYPIQTVIFPDASYQVYSEKKELQEVRKKFGTDFPQGSHVRKTRWKSIYFGIDFTGVSMLEKDVVVLPQEQ